ncbi:MAG: glycogen synthase GlgA [Gammaproteobacteria bacterium]|nr:glycogen synthase GlgA [Gammaproteobacteria bacterium]
MRVLFAAAEVFPLVKTGGLGDVAYYLPLALREQGVDARIIMPAYGSVLATAGRRRRTLARLDLPGHRAPARLLTERMDGGVPIYLVDVPGCFDRDGNPYLAPDGHEWPDNARRYAAFCRAVAALAAGIPGVAWRPDVLHANDWHTGLAPALLAGAGGRPGVLFAIHNLAFQGLYPHAELAALGLPAHWWSLDGLEFHGRMSFMKGGLVYADRIVTVSPRYAREILTPEFGCGLDGLLRHRRDVLSGIVNGVDYRVWDPRHDVHIAHAYCSDDPAGKRANRDLLRERVGLARTPAVCLFGHVSRLSGQKGTDLLLAALPALLARHRELQCVLVGSGEAALETALAGLARAWPGRVAVEIGYDETLAHQVIAGADAFVMPSRFEPCGLSQLYSLRYGTVPVVHATGGLRDTVVDATPAALGAGLATGFWFEQATVAALTGAMDRALALHGAGDGRWQALMRTGMAQDFGWENSARAYLDLYHTLPGGHGVRTASARA